MNAFHWPQGWRGGWLLATGALLIAITLLAINLFPSRADITAVWLRKAVAIEKQVDPAVGRMEAIDIRQRFAGMSDETALAHIRTNIDTLYPELLIAARSTATVPGGFTSPLSPRQKAADNKSRNVIASQVVWNVVPQLANEDMLRRLRSDLQELDALHTAKLASLNRQLTRLTLIGLLLGLMTMALIYLIGVLAERPPMKNAGPVPRYRRFFNAQY